MGSIVGTLTFIPQASDIGQSIIVQALITGETSIGQGPMINPNDSTNINPNLKPCIITVEGPQWMNTNSIEQICQNSPIITLTDYFTGGSSNGGSVVEFYLDDVHHTTSPITTFNPSINPGTHTITAYKPYDNGDFISTITIMVAPQTAITFGSYPSQVCTNQGIIPITASPSGGTWSSANNVIDQAGNFNPGLASPGNLVLSYTYTDPNLASNPLGCISTNTLSLTVSNPPLPVVFSGNTSGCNGTQTQLNVYSPNATKYNWYHTLNDFAPFDTGSTINYTINSTEQLYCVGIGATRCGLSIANAGSVQLTSLTPTLSANLVRNVIPFGGIAQFQTSSPYNINSYLWDFGDGEVSYEASPDHYYYHTGTFTPKVRLISPQGCTNSYSFAPILVGMGDTLSISPGMPRPTGQDSSAYRVNIFPSPFEDHLYFTVMLNHNQTIQYEMIDLTGRLVLQGRFQGIAGNNRFKLMNLENLPIKNYYLLSFKSPEINEVDKVLKK